MTTESEESNDEKIMNYFRLKQDYFEERKKIINNLSFFQNPVDLDQIGNGQRYSERPFLSLKNIDISTNLSSGFLYFTEVKLTIKVHRTDSITNRALSGFILPGLVKTFSSTKS